MRAELDRSDAARFDLKQGEGGLVDLEFLLQWRVLARADADARLACGPRDTPGLLRVACEDDAGGSRDVRSTARGACGVARGRVCAARSIGGRASRAETEAIAEARVVDPRRATLTRLDSRAFAGSDDGAASPSRARTSAATRAVSRKGSTSNGASASSKARTRPRRHQRVHGNAARARARVSPPSTNTGTRVAHASLSMFTESGVQTMRSAHASRPGYGLSLSSPLAVDRREPAHPGNVAAVRAHRLRPMPPACVARS